MKWFLSQNICQRQNYIRKIFKVYFTQQWKYSDKPKKKKMQIRVIPPAILLKSYSWFQGSSSFLFTGRKTNYQRMMRKLTYHPLCKSNHNKAPVIRSILRTPLSTVFYILIEIWKQSRPGPCLVKDPLELEPLGNFFHKGQT